MPTPDQARGFLEALVDRELIAGAAHRANFPWTKEDSAQFAAARDRLILRPALEAALSSTRHDLEATGDSLAGDAAAVGIAVRERAIHELAPLYHEPELEALARSFAALPRPSADSSLAAQMRALAKLPDLSDTARAHALAETDSVGTFTTGDLIDLYARIQPVYRPHITQADQIRDLVDNGLFERWLRREASRQGWDRSSALEAALERERDLIAVRHLMDRDVYGTIGEPSPAVLAGYHRDHAERWTLPLRMRVVRLTASDEREAHAMTYRLTVPSHAESLVARGRREGVRFEVEISAQSDSVLFAAAQRAGPNTVVGPLRIEDGWVAARVVAVLPPNVQPLPQVEPEVRARWHDDEAADRLRELLERERRRVRVRNNADAFADLTEP